MAITVHCGKCGISFTYPRNRLSNKWGKVYCGKVCWYSRNSAVNIIPKANLQSLVCHGCGKSFLRPAGVKAYHRLRRFHSAGCYHSYNRGSKHASWRGGRWLEDTKGYWMVNSGNGRARAEHIIIAERALGRRLKGKEVVHHINGDKMDNRNSNLLLCTSMYHTWLHHEMGRRWAQEHLGKGV